jgi:hypothetical protein
LVPALAYVLLRAPVEDRYRAHSLLDIIDLQGSISSSGWLTRNRRLSKDYERRVQTSETLVEVALIRLMLKWLARGV